MRRKRPFQKKMFWRKGRGPQEALDPFLCAVRLVPPPEGLLQSIERELEEMPPGRPKRRYPSRRYLAIPAAAACIGIAVPYLEFEPRERVALLDPTGRTVAQFLRQDGDAFVKLLLWSTTEEAGKAWHLWGLVPDGARPVHIGVIADAGLAIRNPERFAGYAISMEDRGFAGDVPVGPVIALSVEK